MADLKIKIKGDDSGFKRALSSAKGGASTFASSIKRMFSSGANIGLGAIAAGFGALATASIKAAMNFETTSTAFKTMLGSAKLSGEVLADLTEFSMKTPFEPTEVYKAARTLLAFGTNAKEVTNTIRLLGDISAGTGKDLNELSMIYGKVFVKGKMQAEELNQLSEAGIPVIRQLQEQYGKTAEEIFKMGSAGKLSFADLQSSFSSMTSASGIFFNAMINQSETAAGKLSTLSGNWEDFKRTIGGTKTVKKSSDALNWVLETYTGFIKMTEQHSTGKTGKAPNLGAEMFLEAVNDIMGSKGQRSATHGATTKEEIARARIERNRRWVAEWYAEQEAKRKRDEAAARLASGETGGATKDQTKLRKNALQMLQSGGTLSSLGGDISGGGFIARGALDAQKVALLKEISLYSKSTQEALLTMTQEGRAFATRTVIKSAIKD